MHFGQPGAEAEKPLVRMVFVEPPPPPPAPLGLPDGAGRTVPSMPSPKVDAPVKAAEKKVKKPGPSDAAHRLRRADAKAKPERVPEPALRPAGEPEVETAATPEAAAPGVAQGAIAGQAGGVVGGVAGGVTGGIVGGAGAGPVSAGQIANPPVLVRRVPPEYPEEARRKEIEGLVVLEAILDREGRVEPDVQVVRSIPILDEEAVSAVRKWRFRPGRDRDGSPVRVILEIPIRFVLR